MKKLLISAILITALGTVSAEDDKGIPPNRFGIQLNTGFKFQGGMEHYPNNNSYDNSGSEINISPQINVPLNNRYGFQFGYNFNNTISKETNGSTTEINSLLTGPSLSILRYCDPCWSEEDCNRFFSFLGFDFDMIGGDRKYEYRFNNIINSETGRIRQTMAAITGGAAYRLGGNVYAQVQTDLVCFQSTKTTYDSKEPERYNTNSHVGILRNFEAGVRVNF